MKRAFDFRVEARRALGGNWGKAVLVALLASLLISGVGVVQTGSGEAADGYLRLANHQGWIALLMISLVSALVSLVVGGAVQLGWSRFNLNMVRNKPARVGDLFSQFDRLGTGFAMVFLTGLFVFLWSLLLVVPGIIASYRYALAPYLLADHPEMSAMEAIRESGRLMKGRKWRLFCLQFSFFGWALLSVLTLGVGYLWLMPYMQSAYAAFYEDAAGPAEKAEPEPRFSVEF